MEIPALNEEEGRIPSRMSARKTPR